MARIWALILAGLVLAAPAAAADYDDRHVRSLGDFNRLRYQPLVFGGV